MAQHPNNVEPHIFPSYTIIQVPLREIQLRSGKFLNENGPIVVIEEEKEEEETPSFTPIKDHLEDVTIPKT